MAGNLLAKPLLAAPPARSEFKNKCCKLHDEDVSHQRLSSHRVGTRQELRTLYRRAGQTFSSKQLSQVSAPGRRSLLKTRSKKLALSVGCRRGYCLCFRKNDQSNVRYNLRGGQSCTSQSKARSRLLKIGMSRPA